ncbi:MFS transporter [Prevotella sp. oral taxon 317]|jgi:putative transport-related membrane protein|uniref:MFS transporter n=1 Tax=Prevotella sp. oral taxon 317 TaxID=652721 RepID=UPI0001C3F43D|nr:MFS transporter [Prevotella sp. oral taxon 317]EFC69442.1 transporter, major facilitator family protein [Prevotella sp. oral taxon 317 str. F0108]
MDTQNTPVHISLWHADFWILAITNLLITMSVYMLIPILPIWMLGTAGLSQQAVGTVMGVYGIGLFLLGGFCNWLVQRYRRNRVCLWAIALVFLSLLGCWLVERELQQSWLQYRLLLFLRIVLGAAFGLVQMILSSTLIIDKSESFQRTEANHASAWFGRFALSLGPMLGIVFARTSFSPLFASAALALVAYLLLATVKFPFRTPDDGVKKISGDRFFLPDAKWLFLNLFLICLSVGILMSTQYTAMFYAMVMVGFAIALLAERFAFVDADLKSQVVAGSILIAAALMMILTRKQMVVNYISPVFVGLGIGLIGSRFLLFFIKLSKHCQRGTAVSTYMLGWESGLAAGLFVGYFFFAEDIHLALSASLACLILAFGLYVVFTHQWYIRKKNR